MKKELFNELICPLCKSKKLYLVIHKREGEEIESGRIECKSCNRKYAINNGIPIMIDSGKNYESYENWDILWKKAKSDIEGIKKLSKRELLNYFGSVRIIGNHGTMRKSLEIGCGSGLYSIVLSKLGIAKDIYLMDISLESLKLARKIFEEANIRCHLVLADAFFIPFPENHFDVSLSGGLIEHFKFDVQKKLVGEHCRVSRRTAIQVPTNTVIYWFMRTFITLKSGGWVFGYERPISYKRLVRLLDSTDFLIKDEAYHDVLTAFYYFMRPRIRISINKNFLNLLAKHEIIIYAETPAK